MNSPETRALKKMREKRVDFTIIHHAETRSNYVTVLRIRKHNILTPFP